MCYASRDFVSEGRFETVGQVELGLPPDLGFVAL